MLTIRVKGTDTEYSITIDRDRLLHLWPNSMLGSVVQLDPNTEVIDITSPDITRVSLDSIQFIADHDTLPIVPVSKEYITASHYFGIDVLMVLAEPKWNQIRTKHPDINLVHLTPEQYKPLLMSAIMYDLPLVRQYALRSLLPRITKRYDGILILEATKFSRWDTVQQLYHRKLTNRSLNRFLCHVASRGHLEWVNTVLSDPRLIRVSHHVLVMACLHDQVAVVDRLLQDKRIDPTAENNLALGTALAFGQSAVEARLRADPRIRN